MTGSHLEYYSLAEVKNASKNTGWALQQVRLYWSANRIQLCFKQSQTKLLVRREQYN